LEWSK